MTEKVATPEKRNLLLSRARAQIESLTESDARYVPEYDLLERLLGKTTRQAARIIAEEFVTRFGTISGTADLLTKLLSTPGRAETWAELEERILAICKNNKDVWEIARQDENRLGLEEELFFYRVIDVIDALPKRRDYKAPEKKMDCGDPKSIAEGFVTCELCWRSVPVLVHTKKIHLCHLHDIPSTSPEYRRQKHLQKYVDGIFLQLKQCVATPHTAEQKSGYHPAGYVWALCVDTNSPLRYLVSYLKSLDMPLDSVENVARALEHPVYLDKLTDPLKRAWEFYFEDRGAYLEKHYARVLLAEAWLRADAEHKHGGKR
ncbi:MAG: hypothetical protein DELT_00814 [Desulfovibrio sp.]